MGCCPKLGTSFPEDFPDDIFTPKQGEVGSQGIGVACMPVISALAKLSLKTTWAIF